MKIANVLKGYEEGFRVWLIYEHDETEMIQFKNRKAYREWIRRNPDCAKIPHVCFSVREIFGALYKVNLQR